MVESNTQITGVMKNLGDQIQAGVTLAKRLESQLILEQSALTSREVDVVESILVDKQKVLNELDVVEEKINEIFSYLNVVTRQWSQTTRSYIHSRYPQIDAEIERFIEGIKVCKRRGMENDGLLNLQLLQVSSTIDMLSPGSGRTGNPTYSTESNLVRETVSTSQWVA